MSTDDQELLAKISQLAGQINRHKNGNTSDQWTQHQPSSRGGYRGGYTQAASGWGSSRGGYPSRGYGGRLQVHRNRSLVINNNLSKSNIKTANLKSEIAQVSPATLATAPGWVTKSDRHLQLINSSVYDRETQNRAKAMEETRRQKLKQRNEVEKSKLSKHLYRGSGNHALQSRHHEITVNGIQFRVARDGSKLVKVPGDLNAAKATPKMATVGRVKFYRSKNGNLIRAGIVRAYRETGAVKKVNEPCKSFTTTGSCSKGPRCRYIHDPSKVAVCKEFLLRSSCPSGDSCDLSHDLTPERTPFCLHFGKGNCSNLNCRYAHVRVSPTAPVCYSFGIYGYCEKGSSCEERHVHECPDFSNTGKCTRKGCKLPHRHKASVMRINTGSIEEDSDISSDEDEDEIDSDDIDSDDLEGEFMGLDDDAPDLNPLQQDFVPFS
ncbi:hypothetical protein B0O99DRAFT_626853 [Bisporella sp. PMI_857]|nr:hypothetical protein B0O99DRAFT_626853 [Bisporella sp. PMI_857]